MIHASGKGWALHHGDCLQVLPSLPEASADAVVTDPPYELGFMGETWDASGIAYRVELWAAVLRVLKTGAHLLSFGGTRTYHRMTCAIEDAGFEIRDSLHWIYGTGFPKSLNLGDGLGTALKPGHEPIVLARKPLVGTVAANVAAHGTGALNVDACRIGTQTLSQEEWNRKGSGGRGSERVGQISDSQRAAYAAGLIPVPSGRWPANVLLDDDAAAELDAQSGTSTSTGGSRGGKRGLDFGMQAQPDFKPGKGDTGGASRFFYVAKPSRAERDMGGADNTHPTVKPVELMQYLVRLVTPKGGVVLDPFLGSGTTAAAAWLEFRDFIGIEREESYVAIAAQRATARAAQRSLFDEESAA